MPRCLGITYKHIQCTSRTRDNALFCGRHGRQHFSPRVIIHYMVKTLRHKTKLAELLQVSFVKWRGCTDHVREKFITNTRLRVNPRNLTLQTLGQDCLEHIYRCLTEPMPCFVCKRLYNNFGMLCGRCIGEWHERDIPCECGNMTCQLQSIKCCHCSDQRPMGRVSYYRDGVGMVLGNRTTHYCPACREI